MKNYNHLQQIIYEQSKGLTEGKFLDRLKSSWNMRDLKILPMVYFISDNKITYVTK